MANRVYHTKQLRQNSPFTGLKVKPCISNWFVLSMKTFPLMSSPNMILVKFTLGVCPFDVIKVQMLECFFSLTTLSYILPLVITFNQQLIMLHLWHKGIISAKVNCSMARLGTDFSAGFVRHCPFVCTWEVWCNFRHLVKNGTENKSVALELLLSTQVFETLCHF